MINDYLRYYIRKTRLALLLLDNSGVESTFLTDITYMIAILYS